MASFRNCFRVVAGENRRFRKQPNRSSDSKPFFFSARSRNEDARRVRALESLQGLLLLQCLTQIPVRALEPRSRVIATAPRQLRDKADRPLAPSFVGRLKIDH